MAPGYCPLPRGRTIDSEGSANESSANGGLLVHIREGAAMGRRHRSCVYGRYRRKAYERGTIVSQVEWTWRY